MRIQLNRYKELGKLKNRIYRIISPSGHSYVGRFKSIKRLKDYLTQKCKKQPLIYKSIKKYGIQNHILEILTDQQELKNLDKYQQAFIRHYDTFKNGLNCTTGGHSYAMTEEIKKKISIANKGRVLTAEQRKNIGEGHKGLVRSKEHCENLSKVNKGKLPSDKCKEAARIANTGRKKTESQLEKMRINSTGRKHTPQAKKKISQARIKAQKLKNNN